eukprot:CAMPEP_0113677642 /NCGR_PEP_ID=MMETSP0038_2-20120614/9406_1 /TAXON_ID=2898 /ORGANISM="Cryptomonas paramecium" /LENGTH=114 /DNA_ID=CAMNT_0000594993 /DNA_START=65 /DNA_END=409 /DNA_ORIENTATION=+ /assembly_acc=CAM_ASM_000170
MSVSGQEGIDRLLQAEQEATEIVAKARKEKAARIKAARDEAQAEIAKFRQQMEQEFQQAQFGVLSGGDKSIRLATETEAQLNEIKTRSATNRMPVLQQILSWIETVDVTPPKKA